MRILFAARRGFDYNRVRVLLAGLREVLPQGVECHTIAAKTRSEGRRLRDKAAAFDLLYVPPFRHRDVHFVKAHSCGKPVVFDPLIGNYLTRVEDYGWWWRKPFARYRDRKYFGVADHLLFDTQAHRRWTIDAYGFDESRCHTLYIGAETDVFTGPDGSAASAKTPGQTLTIGFYGSFVPLQGVEVIVRAMHLLRHRADLRFEIIGNFATRPDITHLRERLPNPNVTYVAYLPYAELAERVRDFDICLGVFGASVKADVVIPNKVYHYAAVGRPTITRESRGVAELFAHGRDIYTVPHSDAAALAAAIEVLVADVALRQNLGHAAAALIRERYNAVAVAESFVGIARKIV